MVEKIDKHSVDMAKRFIERENSQPMVEKTTPVRRYKTNLNSIEQKMKPIDVFVNSVYVYDDKILVILNYKDGEKCVNIEDLDIMAKKREHP